jgi:hypothetical protein
MPVYFFDLHSRQRQFLDDEGTELPSALAARDEALAAVRELTNPSAAPARWVGWSLRIRDEQGTSLLRLPIGISPTGSMPDAVPPMLVSTRPADHDLPVGRVQEAPPPRPPAGAREQAGFGRAAERDRSVLLLERCRKLLKALSQEVITARQEIGRSRRILTRARAGVT